MTLTREHGGDTIPPDLLDGIQDPQFVVNQHILFRRKPALDIIQLLLLVDVDQHPVIDFAPQSGTLHLAGLENRVAI